MARKLPELNYESWKDCCDTLHSYTQILGKLAVKLAPPEPQLQHAAQRLTARGWETGAMPAPDGSGSIVVALDFQTHEAVVEHSNGLGDRVPLYPSVSTGELTRELVRIIGALGGEVEIATNPQEVPWTVPLDEDEEHNHYDPSQVANWFTAATEASLALAEFRAPFRGRSTPVNAWWGSFDLAVNLFSGEPADPPSDDFIMRNAMDAKEFAIGWWPGDARYGKAAFYAYAHPAPPGFADADLSPAPGYWNQELGEFVLDWDVVRMSDDPRRTVQRFGQAAFQHTCEVCNWDAGLAGSAKGDPPPVR
ncbi:MAG: DUF5996 family protein [Actinomycetota bacterium]|nr:DUF5996 family protein [Actinomycetota bacterium]